MGDSKFTVIALGVFFLLGLSSLGYLLGNAAITFKKFERTVTVKGLSEREYPADIVLLPIQFIEASNDLEDLYTATEKRARRIKSFLEEKGLQPTEISLSSPATNDLSMRRRPNEPPPEFRYTAIQTVTIYSENIETVRAVMSELAQLGKEGIAFTGGSFQSRAEYTFARLNEVKPEMIAEATREARQVALKFAEDSESELGKIKRASQGRFTISPRDKNNPHIKRVRVVSTIEYYLSD
jgi:hypothetical protein